MSYLGRLQQGDILSLRVGCRSGGPKPEMPVRAPRAIIIREGTVVAAIEMSSQDRYRLQGIFQRQVLLDGTYPAGNYVICYHFNAAGFTQVEIEYFQVVSGGNVAGQVTAMQQWRRPEADYIVAQRNDGTIVQGRNPAFNHNEEET